MKSIRFVWLLFIVCLLTSTGMVSAQNEPITLNSRSQPFFCPYEDAHWFQPGVFPRYIAAQGALALVTPDGTIVQVMEAIEHNVRVINWSPDCRYLTGAVGSIRAYGSGADRDNYVWWVSKDIVIWDAVAGGRVHTFPNNPGEFLSDNIQPAVVWHPAATYALILGGCPFVHRTSSCLYDRKQQDVLWDRTRNRSYRVGDYNPLAAFSYEPTTFNQFYWDDGRSWLWGSGESGVRAYDIHTGQRVKQFTLPVREHFFGMERRETRFRFSDDNTRVIIYSIVSRNLDYSAIYSDMIVYTIEGGAPTHVDVEGFVAPEIPLAPYHPVALSPDNRYLIAGYSAIRVWDLLDPPDPMAERQPIYRHGGPEALIQSVRFIDADTIETTSADGVQRWSLHTGVYVGGG